MVIAFQGVIAITTAFVFMFLGFQKFESSLFGGATAIMNTMLLARSVTKQVKLLLSKILVEVRQNI